MTAQNSVWTERKSVADPSLWAAAVVWLFFAAASVLHFYPRLAENGAWPGDSLMRLAEVRDYLAGAPWGDLVQQRLGPSGTEMHWSRLIDWPLAALIGLFSHFMKPGAAETLTIAVWPPLLLGPFLFGTLAASRRLAGPSSTIPALVFVLCSGCGVHFTPGNIDHHNAQLALTALLLAAVTRSGEGGAWGAAAGLLAGLMLSIGLETLLAVCTAGAGLALAWAFLPERFAPGARAFGLAFASAMAAQRMISAPPAQWLDLRCDIASAPYIAAAIAAGAGLAALTIFGPATAARRAVALAGLAAASAIAMAAVRPACLRGPLADVDPRVLAALFHYVHDTRNIVQIWRTTPVEAIVYVMAPAIALAASAAAVRRAGKQDFPAWAMLAAMLSVSLIAGLLMMRAIIFSWALAVPPLAWLVVRTREAAEGRSTAAAALMLAAVYVVPNQIVESAVGMAIKQRFFYVYDVEAGVRCDRRQNYAVLASLPPGVVLAPYNLSGGLIAHTRHRDIAGGYHRNASGILDGHMAFEGGTVDEARAVALRRHAKYVVVCPGVFEADLVHADSPGSLLDRLLSGDAPPWLEPVDANGPVLRIWRVREEAAPGGAAYPPEPGRK